MAWVARRYVKRTRANVPRNGPRNVIKLLCLYEQIVKPEVREAPPGGASRVNEPEIDGYFIKSIFCVMEAPGVCSLYMYIPDARPVASNVVSYEPGCRSASTSVDTS